MSRLRDKMKDEMILRGFSESTMRAYTMYMVDISKFIRKSPMRLTDTDIKGYFLHLLKERKLSFSAVLLAAAALKFFLRLTGLVHLETSIPKLKRPEQVATVMNQSEIEAFLNALDDVRKRAIFVTIYSAGLRVGEVCNLELRDVDSERRQIRVRSGKGRKDRYTILFPEAIACLEGYIQEFRPRNYLFYPRGRPDVRMRERRIEAIFQETKIKAKMRREVTVHTLRHTFATNLLESGVNVFTIQRLMGHANISTTMRYFHLRETAFSDIPSPMQGVELKESALKAHDQMSLIYGMEGISWR